MKKILGLDLGTNSIGWALIEGDMSARDGRILGAGSRILPMSQDILSKFDSGQSHSQTAERTAYRGVRRLRERHLLRRERLHRVLNILGYLPEHYAKEIDFEKRLGQFVPGSEPKLAYTFDGEQADFIFKKSFAEMLQDFKEHQPQLLEGDKRIPYDWTIYYLRKKALTNRIEKEELAWLLLNFNQKRGYYQLRGEDEEINPGKRIEFYSLRVVDVIAGDDRKSRDDIWYNVYLENGWIYRRTSKIPLDWIGKTKEFIVTTDVNDDGSVKLDKEGKERRSFRAPDANDWTLVKKRTEQSIDKSNKTVGAYIYDNLLKNPTQKIKGKLVRVVERKFYKAELETILKQQQTFHPELKDKKLYLDCLEELYEYNESHKNNIRQKDFLHLFLNDIIFYQRPLKSKKSLISNCKFESKTYMKDGKRESIPVKCIASSHPLFQEFRLWEFLKNLKIYEHEKDMDGKLHTDVNVTCEFLQSEEDWVALFEWLNDRKEIEQKVLFKQYFKIKKVDNYRWNYVDKVYPCNETRAQITTRLSKVEHVPADFLSKENEEALWHILYSVDDKNEVQKALKTFSSKKGLSEDFVEHFRKFPPFKKEYGAYSAKAIKKMLPLMRAGKYWNEDSIHITTKDRIEKILTGEFDETIRERVREKSLALKSMHDFKRLPHWLVSYIVYDRHSEEGTIVKWNTANDIIFPDQHSLRNPIVEQVINETLRIVRDIWKKYGDGQASFFDEIHIELGREMKNPAAKRKQMTDQIRENENTNVRIKALLTELLNDPDIENVRPYSPMQQEILKIYEEGVLNGETDIPDDILKISKQAQPGTSELIRYKLWLQQKYRSPYTGSIIPLHKLFTPAFEIEHIIPQSRYFDDSFSNKIICEAAVNKEKDNNTAYEFIKNNQGKRIEAGFGAEVTLFTLHEYEGFVTQHFSKSRTKMKKLLMEDIPESFIQRQLNDSRYISKVVKSLMSNIVREEGEQDAGSKNVIVTSGGITSSLKQDWGLNDIWNEIITPRFERLNALTNTNNFGGWTNKDGKRVFQTQVPLELSKGFSKKRIDHRHHAMDAIIIACVSRSHINYLNNESAIGKGKTKEEKEQRRYDLKHKLCFKKYNDNSREHYKWMFHKPWETFTQDVKNVLLNTVVTFKKNLRVLNKTINHYQAWREGTKVLLPQIKGDNWAIRKPLHKDTVSGMIQLKLKKFVSIHVALDNHEMIVDKNLRLQVKTLMDQQYDKKAMLSFFKRNGSATSKVEIYYWNRDNVASRVMVNENFNSSNIESITDVSIRKIMGKHLQQFDEVKGDKITEHPELAFTAEGLDTMNKNIAALNGGKQRAPIYKVRTYEPKGNKFCVGQAGNKGAKYVEAAQGTNLFFAVYKDEKGCRNYETIPLNIVIERLKQGLSFVPELNDAGHQLLFHISPNDLVYVPTQEELAHYGKFSNAYPEMKADRIYKVVSFTGNQCFFIRNDIAVSIINKKEFSAMNKMEKSIDGIMIKEVCIKLNMDRLGNIKATL